MSVPDDADESTATAVAVVALGPGPLADITTGDGAQLVADLEALIDSAPRALLLDARGGAGCREPRPPTPSGLHDPAAILARFPAPTIAVWDGPAIGAGAEVLLAADVRVIGPGATLQLPEVEQGELPCWGGTQRLTRVAGVALALRAIVLGDELGAEELERSGAAIRVDDPVGHAEALAARLAAGAPRAQAAARDAVQRGRDLTIAEGHRVEADLNLLLSTTVDRAEGIDAFFAKRPPNFRGE
ncbi:MAG TPA: enoyl-CoA hydratase/isomerase family protein [Acidimicrobiia bacterium]|nr:enoyl-CoA hydratase/isomerase family protein [Acidimicrobiia bacterium]